MVVENFHLRFYHASILSQDRKDFYSSYFFLHKDQFRFEVVLMLWLIDKWQNHHRRIQEYGLRFHLFLHHREHSPNDYNNPLPYAPLRLTDPHYWLHILMLGKVY